jgi:hypothetical protein
MTFSIKPTTNDVTLQHNGSDIMTIDNTGVTMGSGMTLDASTLSGSLDASILSGSLPAIDGSALTGISSGGIGQSQTWSNPSRAFNTTYTNSTGFPIMVCFTPNIGSVVVCNGTMLVGSITTNSWAAYDNASTIPRYGMSMIVPNGSTYRINNTGSTIRTWAELR